MNAESVKQCLGDVGCCPEKAARILRFLETDQLQEARRTLKCLRCDLVEDMHRSQRRVDRIDWLIRETEKIPAAEMKR